MSSLEKVRPGIKPRYNLQVGKKTKGYLLEPKDGAKAATEEYTLHSSKGNNSLAKRVRIVNPLQSPLSLFNLSNQEEFESENYLSLDSRDGIDSIEELGLFLLSADVGVNKKRISLRMDVLNSNLV
jgi:hypothetical protein